MAEINDFTNQLQIVGAGDKFDDTIVFYSKRNSNGDIQLGVSADNNDIVLSTVDANGNTQQEIERFHYGEISVPTSSSLEDLVTQVNNFIQDGTDSGSSVVAGSVEIAVRNNSGGVLSKCQVVYISGFHSASGEPEVSKADADGSGTYPVLGLIKEDIADSSNGDIVFSGRLEDCDTSAWSIGDDLYMSTDPSTTNGLTSTKPTGASTQVQKVAEVIKVDASTGILQVFGAGRSNDLPNIEDGKIWIGNGSDVPTAVTMSGDATISNTGVVTISVSLSDLGLEISEPDLSATSNYTLLDGDSGKLVVLDKATAITLDVDTGLSSDFWCIIMQKGAGQVTIAGTATVNNADGFDTTEKQWVQASIKHLGSDVFVSDGRLVA